MTDRAEKQGSAGGQSLIERAIWLAAGPLLAAIFLVGVWIMPAPILHRYLLGHPICWIIVGLFFVALCSLTRIWLHARRNEWIIDSIRPSALCPTTLLDRHVSLIPRVKEWLQHLSGLPKVARQGICLQRLQVLLERQLRRGDTQGLNDDLREMSDRDGDDAHGMLGLVRTTIWAIPMFGFLGTVVGITQTLGDLDFTNSDAAMEKLKAGLYVAFDTTALGIALSVIAIYLQMPVEGAQQKLLSRIDQLMFDLLPPNLSNTQTTLKGDPVADFNAMAERLIQSIDRSVQMQTEVWRQSMNAAQQQWQLSVGTAGDQVQAALAGAIDSALDKHATVVDQLQREGAESIDRRWKQWQNVLSENARVMSAQQKALVQQGELLAAAVERSEELVTLRTALEQNLTAVSQTLETMGTTQDLASAMRTLGRAVEMLAERNGAAPAPRGRAAA